MSSSASPNNGNGHSRAEKGQYDDESRVPLLTKWSFFMAVLVSMGGIVFGYDTGQISGFVQMHNFEENFADQRNPLGFGDVREGLIVAMVSVYAF